MRYRFAPQCPAANPASRRGRGAVAMVAGGEYDVDPEWAAMLLGTIPGADGGPCLIPLAEVQEPAPPRPARKRKR